MLDEKWGGEADVKKLDKYGKEQRSLSDLRSKQKALRSKENRTPAESKELKRINFAIRARTGWGKAEGVKESVPSKPSTTKAANSFDKKYPRVRDYDPRYPHREGMENEATPASQGQDAARLDDLARKVGVPTRQSGESYTDYRDRIRKAADKTRYWKVGEAKKPKLGSGGRFKSLVKKLAAKEGVELTEADLSELEEYKVRNPKALAAWIGRKKYGKNKFQKMAAKGRK